MYWHAVFLDFRDAIIRDGEDTIRTKYGNLFQMYEKIVDDNPYKTPMMIYPATHYTMGGVWVDYNLMSSIPGCYVVGEANFSDHGANRLGASALMQGLADGYFILPYTIGDYLSNDIRTGKINADCKEFEEAEKEHDLVKQSQALTFVVIGGGPTGVEIAGAIGEINQLTLRKDFRYINFSKTKIYLLESGPRLLPSFSEKSLNSS